MIKKILIFCFLGIVIAITILGYRYYNQIFKANVDLKGQEQIIFFIPSGADYQVVKNLLKEKQILINLTSFDQIAQIKKYPQNVKSGRYIIKNGLSNNELINMLRSGSQVPVKVTFNNVRTINEMAGIVSKQIEADSAEIVNLLSDNQFIAKLNLNQATKSCIFIPNTYEFYWNTSAQKFIEKMHKEYQKFWNNDRKNKAKNIGLTETEVVTLASIVQSEQSNHNEEKPIIAGLYLNRLKRGILLQSDPTVVFAKGDFSVMRVLNRDKEIDSPYNTYKYAGLPPGPINMPELSSIEAVLNYQPNDYLFMCAKDDFSGYHYFSKTNAQHSQYARNYQRALSRRGILR